jgi:hypothetical protein
VLVATPALDFEQTTAAEIYPDKEIHSFAVPAAKAIDDPENLPRTLELVEQIDWELKAGESWG